MMGRIVRRIVAGASTVVLIAGALVGLGVSQAAASTCNPFPDVTSANSACANIAWLKDQGITKPTSGYYHPTAPVTRGAMTAFLFRLTHPGQPSPNCVPGSFPDVQSSNVFCGYLSWAAETGVAQGYSDGTFRSDNTVTRGAMAAFLRRIATDTPTPKCTTKPYSDVAISDTFCGVITWMKSNEITYGIGGGKYGTTLPVTRQAMASFLHRIANLMARTAPSGPQLPGGGFTMFPGRRLVALYGSPFAKNLGVLGHQDLSDSITRAKNVAAQYQKLSAVPVIPTFEIIATLATAGAGPDGDYSMEFSADSLRPWVTAAGKAGLYVILDLQPGRASILAQAKRYQSLLELPYVGLAIDPEWKLTSSQLPNEQIGHVDASQVNAVTSWLGWLTDSYNLPQKVLVVHQFRTSMIQHESALVTGNPHVKILINMDGQGSPTAKQDTWREVVAAAPAGVAFGWQIFYDQDHPMLTPAQTMANQPTPNMVIYQ
jgi:hypothetical protein